MCLNIGKGLLPVLLHVAVFCFISHDAGARAVAAVGETEAGHQKQRPVRIAVHNARRRAVPVFCERVAGFPGRRYEFIICRHHRAAHRVRYIDAVDKACIIGRDADRKLPCMMGQRFALILGNHYKTGQARHIGDAVAELPVPVVPLSAGYMRIEAFIKRP